MELSIPKYVITKIYNSFFKKIIFPSITLTKSEPEPDLITQDWLKVTPLLSGICGSDLNTLKAHESYYMEPYASFPCVLGHEVVGLIKELGTNINGFEVGDLVVINPRLSCVVFDRPLCHFCQNEQESLCENFAEGGQNITPGVSSGYNNSTGGAWSECMLAHKSQIYKLPRTTDLKKAVLIDPLASAWQPIAEYAQGKNEEKNVFIYGAGLIGLLAIVAIRTMKLPWKVTIGYRYEFQKDMALKLGADKCISTGKNFYENFAHEFDAKIRNVSLGKPAIDGGVDVVFDCVGSAQTLNDSLRLAKTKGAVVMVGTGSSLKGVDPAPIWFREVTLTGTMMSRTFTDPRNNERKEVYEAIIQDINNLEIDALVTHSFKLENYKSAIYTALDKKTHKSIKVVFNQQIK